MAGIHIDRQAEFERDGLLGYRLRNNSGGTVNAGEVVVFDTAVQGGDGFTTTTTADDPLVIGMLVDTVADDAYGFVAIMGHVTNLKVNGTTDISVGDYLTTHTVAGIAAKQTAAPKGGVFAIALEAYSTNDSSGVIDAWLWPAGRTDASGNTLIYGNAGQMAADGVAASNNAGVTNAVARIDHAHTLTADAPALVFGTSNAAGTAGSVLSTDATIAIFDATVPGTIVPDTSAATGSALFAARRDHVHGIAGAAPSASGSLVAAGSAAEGVSTSFARADHAHPLLILDDVDVTFGTNSDIAFGHSTANTTSNVDDLVLGLGDTNRALHITSDADKGTDWAVAADANPSVYIHSETTPATDYLKLYHDATDGNLNSVGGSLNIDVPTGENVTIQVNNVDEVVFTATAVTPATNDGSALGSTTLGWEDLHLATGGVINWANGEVTLTETTADILTVAGGDFHIANGQGVIVGHTAQITANTVLYELEVLGTAGADSGIVISRNSADAFSPVVVFHKGRDAIGTFTTVASNGDAIGAITGVPSNGTNAAVQAATVAFEVDGTIGSSTDVPGRIVFSTTPDGSNTLAESFRVANDANIYVANGNGVVIGAQAVVSDVGSATPELQILGTGDADTRILIGRWSADSSAGEISIVKGRGTSIGDATTVADNDVIGAVAFYAEDGTTAPIQVATFFAEVDDATPADGDVGAALVWQTRAGGGGSQREIARLTASGNLQTWNGGHIRVGGADAHSTPGTNSVSFFEGTAPSGAGTNIASIFCIDVATVTTMRKILSDGTASNIET